MNIQYAVSGGQLILDKTVFAKELLKPDSSLIKLLGMRDNNIGRVRPSIHKTEDLVTIDFNGTTDILLEDNYEALFQGLKTKYREKIKGKITIRFTCLSTYYIVVDLNSDDDRMKAEL